jgi:hypothetical protein
MYYWEVNCLAPPCVPNFQDRHELPSVALILGCHAKAQLNKNDLLEHRILQCKSYSTNSTSVYWPNILQLHLCFVIILAKLSSILYWPNFLQLKILHIDEHMQVKFIISCKPIVLPLLSISVNKIT